MSLKCVSEVKKKFIMEFASLTGRIRTGAFGMVEQDRAMYGGELYIFLRKKAPGECLSPGGRIEHGDKVTVHPSFPTMTWVL